MSTRHFASLLKMCPKTFDKKYIIKIFDKNILKIFISFNSVPGDEFALHGDGIYCKERVN